MAAHHRVFRPPQLHVGDAESSRRVTWMELFYDLVYVATLVQLGNYLSDNTTLEGFGVFTLLFVPVWWSWVGTTFYSNRFDSDDVVHRLLVFTQIAIVYLMAINLSGGLGDNTARFALAYAANRVLLVIMYLRAANAIPQARQLATRFGIGFSLAAAIWALSAFLPEPMRYFVWVVALAIDLGTPLSALGIQAGLPVSPNHLPERFGLFTIIVLGEGFLKVVDGMAGEVLTLPQIILDVPGLIISGALWWIYFDNVSETPFRFSRGRALTWLYTHLPMHLALTALGVGIYKLVTAGDVAILYDEYRWLICGSAALSLAAIGTIEWVIAQEWTPRVRSELLLRFAGVFALLALAVLGANQSAQLVMLLVALVGFAQVGIDLYWRYRRQQTEAHAEAPVVTSA